MGSRGTPNNLQNSYVLVRILLGVGAEGSLIVWSTFFNKWNFLKISTKTTGLQLSPSTYESRSDLLLWRGPEILC